MKPFKAYEAAQVMTGPRPKLPIGGYVMRIMNAEEQPYSAGRVLILSVDVAEGEHKNFYAEDYKAQIEPKKWKGTVRLNCAKDDNSEQDGYTANVFKTNMDAIENSNSGYKWDWDETKLKGKFVGVLVRNKEYDYKGFQGFFPECFKLIPAEDVRAGKFAMPKDKLLSDNNSSAGTFAAVEDNDDLPFKI